MDIGKLKNNIHYICAYWEYIAECINKKEYDKIKEYIEIRFYGTASPRWQYNEWQWNDLNQSTSAGIFLGNEEELKQYIDTKLIKSVDIDQIKSIYFSPNCSFPRFRLSEIKNIKKHNTTINTDLIVTDDILTEPYISRNVSDEKKDNRNIGQLILYSNTNKTYYHIHKAPRNIVKLIDYVETADENLGYYSLQFWAKLLIDLDVLPNDCEEYYYGPVCMIPTDEDFKLLTCLLSYNSIMYTQDFEKCISKYLTPLTQEYEQSIINMLKSDNNDTIDLGLKLLTACDIYNNKCKIGVILSNNRRIYHLPLKTLNSTAYKYLLYILGLSNRTLQEKNVYSIINSIYPFSENEVDKQWARDYALEAITQEIQSHIKRLKDNYVNNLDFNFTLKVE